MAYTEEENTDFDSTNFVLFLIKWWKPLCIVAAIAIIASFVFSSPYFITPKYKSTVILFPVSTNSISKALMSENAGSEQDVMEFGEEEQTEQLLQILHSNLIRDNVIAKYNLMDHYDIDSASRYKKTYLFEQYESNVKFRRTEFMAVEISVLDTDPQMAANIANDIAELLDSTKNRMQKERAIRAYRIVEAEYLQLKGEVREMEDSLSVLRGFGVHDYESQSEMINRQLAIEIAKGNTRGVRALEDKLEILALYGGPYVSLRDALEHEKKQLSHIKSKYEEAKVDATEELPHKFVVNYAFKAEKKSYPIRWLIVVVSTISALLLTLIVIIVLENLLKNFDLKKKKYHSIISAPEKYENVVETKVEQQIQKEKEVKHQVVNEVSEKERVVKTDESTSNKIETKKHTIYMDNFFNNFNLLNLFIKWKWHLLIIVVIAVVLSAIFSGPFFITPKFKSYAVLYPSNVFPYSDESETEQMLQLIQGRDIQDSLIRMFNLADHYEIDSTYKYFYSSILWEYGNNVSIRKTEFESIRIEVLDSDPYIARNMINEMIRLYNLKVRALHKSKFYEVMINYKGILDEKRFVLDSIQKRIYVLATEYGLLDYKSQSEEVTKGFLRTVDGSNASRINTPEVLKLKDNIENKGAELLVLTELARSESDGYSEFKLDYDEALLSYNREFTHCTVVTKPYVADKKSYPVRWMIVLFSAFAVFLFALIIVAIIENTRFKKANATS